MANEEGKDQAFDFTESEIKKLERRLRREYKLAAQEANAKCIKFMQKFEVKDAEKRRQMSYGLINEDEYNEWRKRQILQAEHYQQMVDVIASDFAHANMQARQIMAGEMPAIYAENFNFATWEAEEYGRIDTSFSLYNRAVVAELAQHDADLLPLPSPKRLAELEAKDELWNRQLVSSSMMQSIMAGESVPKMAKRLATSVSEKNYHSAVRAARTLSTACQNKARTDAFQRAKANGSDIQSQIWLATLDNRTRHAHRQLDHQEVPIGKPFKVDGYDIAFPGDPSAPGYLIFNCRCSVRARIKGLELIADKTLDYHKLGGQTYEEWKEGFGKGESKKRYVEPEKPKVKEIEFEKAEKAGTAMSYLNKNGFMCSKIPMDISKETFIAVSNRLAELNTQFKVVNKNDPLVFKCENIGFEIVAEVRGNKYTGRDHTIAINNYFYKNNATLIKSHKRMEKKNWSMKAAEGREVEYDITHEYGHLLQDSLLLNDEYRRGIKKCKGKKEQDAFFRQNYLLKSDKQRSEIIKIAKESNPDFNVTQYISDYGKTDSNEFFAEVFANARCGAPNELGDAMNEWLRRHDFDA